MHGKDNIAGVATPRIYPRYRGGPQKIYYWGPSWTAENYWELCGEGADKDDRGEGGDHRRLCLAVGRHRDPGNNGEEVSEIFTQLTHFSLHYKYRF